MAVEVYIPKMSDHMESGTILRWLVEEGQPVQRGQVLFELETDKAVGEVESPADGVLSGVCVRAGEPVPVGAAVAFIIQADEAAAVGAIPGAPTAGAPLPAVPAAALLSAETPLAAAEAGARAGIIPATPVARRAAKELGVDLGRVSGSGPGGRVREGDVRAYAAGLVGQAAALRIAKKTTTNAAEPTAPTSAPTFVPTTVPGALSAAEPAPASATLSEALPSAALPPTAPLPVSAPPPPGGAPAPVSAAAGVDMLSTVSAAPSLSVIQRLTGERMLESVRTIPHFFLQVDVDMTRALELQAAVRGRWVQRERIQVETGEKVSITAILVRVAAAALRQHPRVNASFVDGQLIIHPDVNIGVAMALGTAGALGGLLVPVIHQADRKSLAEINQAVKRFQAQLAELRFSPPELAGGTFTISNLGMYGVDRFSAIINPPQSAILAAGRIVRRPVADENDALVVRPIMSLTLSVDHRSLDGIQGAQFLAEMKALLEQPYYLV